MPAVRMLFIVALDLVSGKPAVTRMARRFNIDTSRIKVKRQKKKPRGD
jgi:hypothetical protein